MAIGLSHGGSTIYSSPSPSSEVLVGTREGVVTIERPVSGSEWRVKHRALTDKHISAIIKEPESGLTFAGAFSGSVHVSCLSYFSRLAPIVAVPLNSQSNFLADANNRALLPPSRYRLAEWNRHSLGDDQHVISLIA